MTPQDTRSLLAWCAHYDGRPPSKGMIQAWYAALHKDLTLTDAKKIVSDHYAKTNYRITVANINDGYMQLRRERLQRYGPTERPQPPSDLSGSEYLIFQNAVTTAIGNGASPAAAEQYAKRQVKTQKEKAT